MTVKEGRILLSTLPEGLTQEEFDETELLMLTLDGEFETPCECQSGIIEVKTPNETFLAFALLPHIDEVDPQLN